MNCNFENKIVKHVSTHRKENLDLKHIILFNYIHNLTLEGRGITSLQLGTRRDQITIMTDLLSNVKEPRRLTHILYRSNMSYSQLVKYLDSLKEFGFLEETKKPFRAFSITDDGKTFMDLVGKKDPITTTN